MDHRLEGQRLPSRIWLPVILCLSGILSACTPEDTRTYEPKYASSAPLGLIVREYIFAVHPLHNPKRLFEVYQPLIELVNERVAPAFHLKLEASRDYASFEAKLAARKFHIALPNPYQTLISERHGYSILAKMGSDEQFRGILIVRRDSKIDNFVDLKGKAISFPAATALAATMMPRLFLFRHGLGPGDFEERYVGSQESAIMNVLYGKTSAAGTWPPPWEALLRRRPEMINELTVKWETTPLVNNGVVVRSDLPSDHVKAVKDILINLHEHERGRAILKDIEIAKFETADTASFEPVRQFVARYDAAFGARQP